MATAEFTEQNTSILGNRASIQSGSTSEIGSFFSLSNDLQQQKSYKYSEEKIESRSDLPGICP